MSHDYSRTERVGAAMQRELAQLIRDEIRDPRLGMCTVQEVRVARDLSHAKVYVTVMDSAQREDSLKVLNHAAGFLRRQLGHTLKLRVVPELHFQYDESVEQGAHLYDLIEKAVAHDEASHKPDED